MCQDCREQGIKRKIAQFEEPNESRKRLSKANKSKGRKVRLDELKAAEKNFWQAFEWYEDGKGRAAACKVPSHKGNGWVCFHGFGDEWFKSRRKRYEEVYAACLKDGLI